LTGFLGSGKTTLLSRIIRSPGMEGTLVVINEFGEVGLDHLLVESSNEQTVLMESGCVCCTMRSDLAQTLGDVALRIARGELPPIRRVVLETTGLADPGPVLQTLAGDSMVAATFSLGGLWTTVDAAHADSSLDRYPESRRQVAMADLLLLTKTDLVDAGAASALRTRLQRLNADAPLFDVRVVDDLPALLTGPEAGQAGRVRSLPRSEHHSDRHAHHHHDDHIRSLCLSYSGRLPLRDVASFLESLARDHGEQILRIKGVVAIAGRDAPVALHGVQHVLHPPVPLRTWADEDRISHIVFIVDDLPLDVIRSRFDAWLQSAAPGSTPQ
jgi:G3E family GTPase